MAKKLLIIGGDGHGSVIASCIRDNRVRFGDNEWEVVGFINDFEEKIDCYPVVGKLSDIDKFVNQGFYFSYGIHLIGRNPLTKEVFEKMNIPEERLATVIHQSAFIGEDVVIEPGCFVMANAYIAPRTHLGLCSMVKANVCIGHDVESGPLCHFAMGAIVGSYSKLGICCDVSLGSIVLEKKRIGDFSMLGAHSLLTHDMPERSVYVGSPARFMREIKKD